MSPPPKNAYSSRKIPDFGDGHKLAVYGDRSQPNFHWKLKKVTPASVFSFLDVRSSRFDVRWIAWHLGNILESWVNLSSRLENFLVRFEKSSLNFENRNFFHRFGFKNWMYSILVSILVGSFSTSNRHRFFSRRVGPNLRSLWGGADIRAIQQKKNHSHSTTTFWSRGPKSLTRNVLI